MRLLSRNINLKTTIMNAFSLNNPNENKKKVTFVNFKETKRLRWSEYRRYGY